jgi:protein-tyrosine phosphatase
LTGGNLIQVLRQYHIKTVVNLRGAEKSDPWYGNETGICQRMGVRHIDVAFSATHLPPPKELDKLVTAIDSAPEPLIVHCMGGSDRSGLAATLFLVLHQGWPLDRAEHDELTLRYGHISFGTARAMDHFFDLYRRTGDHETMREWIQRTYPAVYAQKPR